MTNIVDFKPKKSQQQQQFSLAHVCLAYCHYRRYHAEIAQYVIDDLAEALSQAFEDPRNVPAYIPVPARSADHLALKTGTEGNFDYLRATLDEVVHS